MLLFFGYNDRTSNDFKIRSINMAWGRRIVSGIRLVIQLTAVEGLLSGEYVTTVCVAQIAYLVIIFIAVFPYESKYDGNACYRFAL